MLQSKGDFAVFKHSEMVFGKTFVLPFSDSFAVPFLYAGRSNHENKGNNTKFDWVGGNFRKDLSGSDFVC
jgi:hypothetical protein